ncbi:MAG TPA: FMN-binding protein [Longimicrobiales bacterium]|nr:FMN-binding protein [Longimicrobiales bacterium]
MSDVMSANASAASQLPMAPQVPAARLIATLGVAGALAGLLIVLVFQWAQPRILENRARATQAAISEVLGEGERFQTLFLHNGALTPALPAGVDSMTLDKIYVGYDAADARVGYAIIHSEAGFADQVRVIFGYDSGTGTVLGMRVLENKETPGLGDKIVKDSAFVAGFNGRATPLVGVKAGAGSGGEAEVDMITGATISSRVVIAIINHRLAAVRPLIEQYEQRGPE